MEKTPYLKTKKVTALPTHIYMLVDRSSSMSTRAQEVRDGFNKFIDEQKALPGEAKLTLIFFDSGLDITALGVDLQDFNKLDETNYIPNGMTALYDAVGYALNHAFERSNRGEKKIFCIMTDGEENSSQKFTLATIKEKVFAAQSNGWQFLYLGANLGAFSSGLNMGLPVQDVGFYNDAIAGGTMRGMSTLSASVAQYRDTGQVDSNWNDQNEKNILAEKGIAK